MSHISRITEQLTGIIEPEGPVQKGQEVLENAQTELFNSWSTFYDTLGGNSNPEAQAVIIKMTEALAAIGEAKKMLAATVGGIAMVRNTIMGTGGQIGDRTPQPVHILREGGVLRKGRHSDLKARAKAHTLYRDILAEQQKIQAFVDAAPNLNEEYEEEIAKTQAFFQSLHLPTVPIAVLDGENYVKAASLAQGNEEHDDRTLGFHTAGRIVVNGDMVDPDLTPDQRRRFVFDFLIHEGGHSSGYNPHYFIRSDVQDGKPNVGAMLNIGGFEKSALNADEDQNTRLGVCLEEGWAELTSVIANEDEGLRDLPMTELTLQAGEINYVGYNPSTLPQLGDDPIEIPMNFITVIPLQGNKKRALDPVATPLAYGIRLMDRERPGLYNDMVAARTNPKRQADYIRKINSIEPGLYRKLRDMEYSSEGAEQALRIIGQAITDHRKRLNKDAT